MQIGVDFQKIHFQFEGETNIIVANPAVTYCGVTLGIVCCQ